MALETSMSTTAATDLLSFAESAEAIGDDLEKFWRRVVEDRSIDAVLVDGGGNRKSINLPGLLADGGYRVDYSGRLSVELPKYEQRQRVGTIYEPLGGELRIERQQIEQYLQRTGATAVAVESAATDAASLAVPSVTGTGLPMGLDPDTIASAFDGLGGTKNEWKKRMAKPTVWLRTEPVVTRPGKRGKSQTGQQQPALRNPVAFALVLIDKMGVTRQALNHVFMNSKDLSSWKETWLSRRKELDELQAYWGD